VRIGRDYANPGDYDTRFVGLNGRMSEMHAATALASLEQYGTNQRRRFEIVERYIAGLAPIPGVAVQTVAAGDRSTWKDFTIAIDPTEFGVDRDTLRAALAADGVDTRTYFDPPVHEQQAYRGSGPIALPVTSATARRVLSLPVYPALSDDTVDGIVDVVARAHASARELARRPVSDHSQWPSAHLAPAGKSFQNLPGHGTGDKGTA
jgi:dTDP-4-amino-4,6-dideoxygalactose transaminase